MTPLLLGPVSCTRHRYERPCGELDLGSVKELLYSIVHVRPVACLVYRDSDGWSVLSTRCTYVGCDLTYQEPVLLCPCCKTRYTLDGVPLPGWPATVPLPWIDISYKDGHLFANPCVIHPPSWRFTNPEIEEAIRKLREQVKDENLSDEVKIPGLLTGKGDGEIGQMFLEDDPNLIHELQMVK